MTNGHHALDFERLFRNERGRVLATLIRLLGDFDVAEEALQDAFTIAIEIWPREGTPNNPRAWLVSTARHRAIDRLRRDARFDTEADGSDISYEPTPSEEDDGGGWVDDRLRLIFTCCHPALAEEARVALTLRTICGLTTDEIASAFLVPVPTMAQRLARATGKIRAAKIPYRAPPPNELQERLSAVLGVVYLVFTEGYAATSGDALVRRELSQEAIRLGRLLVDLVPQSSETRGLLALMLLQDSRREARITPGGDLVLLDDQDRSRWDTAQIAEGLSLIEGALAVSRVGPYAIQAAIAALHARVSSAGDTDWPQIVGLYALLMERAPSAVVELNNAVAVAMVDGPAAGLALLDAVAARRELHDYHLLHSARGALLRQLGRVDEARTAYRRALKLATVEPERRFLERQISELV